MEQELTKKVEHLEKDNKFLKEYSKNLENLKNFVTNHFKTTDLEKAVEIIKEKIPKSEKQITMILKDKRRF